METELFASVEAGDFDKFKELIKKETKETIDQVDFYGYTALHAAAENGRLEMIAPLLGERTLVQLYCYAELSYQRPGLTSTEPPTTRPSRLSTTPWPRGTWSAPGCWWREGRTSMFSMREDASAPVCSTLSTGTTLTSSSELVLQRSI